MNVRGLFDLEGRVAVVTGGAAGLGRQMAEALAELGADVVVCGRKEERCRQAAEQLEALGGRTLAVGCDVTQPADVQRLVDATLASFGRIDVLVNNAGRAWGSPLEDMRLEDWQKVLDTNLTGSFLCAQAVGRVMIREGRGAIVNIASVSGLGGAHPDVLRAAAYHASKGGVIAFTRDLACEWASHGIRVNAIAPGWFPTYMSKAVLDRQGERMLAGIPLGRFGGEHDLKGAVAFLASDASAFVTGHVLVVDGGQTVW
ncbi:MAG TPA: SDR family oxidoreductase [Vicinamibacteria bacterium]|nr:SDR family oxidoreductase [Vicinamibacteria bacterium]